MTDPAVRVEGVVKRFGATEALAGVDLVVEEGTVLGLLGPNGAGKTTLVRVLATLLAPDAGRAEVFGRDVVHDAAGVRELVGLTGQFAAVDEMLSGRENLQMFGRLFDLPAAEARRRASELLERFDLADAADRPARPYSGGLRGRRAPARARPRVDRAAPPPRTVPGRAADRPAPAQPQRDLVGRARAGPRRDDAAAHDPVPRGGRSARRADRGDRPRSRDRAGHGERAQGPGGRPVPGAGAGELRGTRPGAGRA